MSPRKKKGVGFAISGVAFLIGSALCFATTATPAWFPVALTVVGLVAGFFGFTTVFPDTD